MDEAQSAFALDRLISDNTILGFEELHSMKQRRQFSSEDYMTLKLDMMKAFPVVLIKRIMTSVTSVRFRILLNEQPT